MMSRPPINPDKTLAGIAVDPHTLERVIPESRRPDGTVRKQLKIRPGFTPQEDVRRFRTARQAQIEANALPKGHIIGWAPPPTSTASSSAGGKPMSKSAKKNAKRKEKRDDKKVDVVIPDSWEDEEEVHDNAVVLSANSSTKDIGSSNKSAPPSQIKEGYRSETHESAADSAPNQAPGLDEELASKIEKVTVS